MGGQWEGPRLDLPELNLVPKSQAMALRTHILCPRRQNELIPPSDWIPKTLSLSHRYLSSCLGLVGCPLSGDSLPGPLMCS